MIDFGGRSIPANLADVVEPARTVLLVWDMQTTRRAALSTKPL